MQSKKAKMTDTLNSEQDKIKTYEEKIHICKNGIEDAKANYNNALAEIETERLKAFHDREKQLNSIKYLPTVYEADTSFFPLKNMSGLEYKKIIGCYIIRNRKNHRSYVGQSKDVIKRIRQHFKGTYPTNMIFAEDYFSVNEIDRKDLFELKIFPCETKDELDRTEKELIEQYEAFSTGYNGTSGNT